MNISSTNASWPQRPDPAEFFKKADTDGSGGISKDELAQMLKNRPGPAGQTGSASDVDAIFQEVDTDGDGQISEAENAAHMAKVKPPGAEGGGAGQSLSDASSSLETLLQALGSSSDSMANKDDLIAQLVEKLKANGDGTSLFTEKA